MQSKYSSDKLPTTYKELAKVHSGPIYVSKFNNNGEYVMTGS